VHDGGNPQRDAEGVDGGSIATFEPRTTPGLSLTYFNGWW